MDGSGVGDSLEGLVDAQELADQAGVNWPVVEEVDIHSPWS